MVGWCSMGTFNDPCQSRKFRLATATTALLTFRLKLNVVPLASNNNGTTNAQEVGLESSQAAWNTAMKTYQANWLGSLKDSKSMWTPPWLSDSTRLTARSHESTKQMHSMCTSCRGCLSTSLTGAQHRPSMGPTCSQQRPYKGPT